MWKSKSKSKSKRVKKSVRKSKFKRRYTRRAVPERASCTETRTFTLLNTNQMYQSYNLQLSNFSRAVQIAKGYQLFRIKNVKYILRPLSDTYIAGGTGGAVPYVYYMIDRLKSLQSVNSVQQLRRMGAKPRRLDDKVVTFQYRPSVLTATLDGSPPFPQGSSQFTQYKVTPWLPTRDTDNLLTWNPDSTDHQGIIFMVDNSGTNIPFGYEQVVEFEFMKPAVESTLVEGFPEPVEIEDVLSPPEQEV